MRDPQLLAGKYVLGDLLGAGAMGVVFQGVQLELARPVAIKFLRRELADIAHLADRFRIEAIAAARLTHPNIVHVIDFGESSDGRPFLVMELVIGPTLGELIRGHGPLSAARAVRLVRELLDGLGDAHAAGVVHADVKSDNILVEQRPDGLDHAKLSDFGLARIRGAAEVIELLAGDVLSGTPEYMAPEIIRGDPPSPASDLYAVGVILYEALTGATPFGGGTASEVMVRHLEDALVPPSLRAPRCPIPRELEQVVARALAKSPAERFRDADAFAEALRAAPAPACDCSEAAVATVGANVSTIAMRPHGDPIGAAPASLGADPAGRERLLRMAIGAAIVRGSVEDVADGYLRLARHLAGRAWLRAALRELEEGLDLVTAGDPSDPTADSPAARLRAAMVPLFDRLAGRPASAAGDALPTLTDVA